MLCWPTALQPPPIPNSWPPPGPTDPVPLSSSFSPCVPGSRYWCISTQFCPASQTGTWRHGVPSASNPSNAGANGRMEVPGGHGAGPAARMPCLWPPALSQRKAHAQLTRAFPRRPCYPGPWLNHMHSFAHPYLPPLRLGPTCWLPPLHTISEPHPGEDTQS